MVCYAGVGVDPKGKVRVYVNGVRVHVKECVRVSLRVRTCVSLFSPPPSSSMAQQSGLHSIACARCGSANLLPQTPGLQEEGGGQAEGA